MNQFQQKEFGRSVDDEMKLLNVFDSPGPGIGLVIEGEPPAPEEAVDDDCRWELQHRALEIENAASKAHGGSLTARLESKRAIIFQHTLPAEVTGDSEPPPSPQPATLGLAEMRRKMDQRYGRASASDAREVAGDSLGKRYSAAQQYVDDLRAEIGSVRG